MIFTCVFTSMMYIGQINEELFQPNELFPVTFIMIQISIEMLPFCAQSYQVILIAAIEISSGNCGLGFNKVYLLKAIIHFR